MTLLDAYALAAFLFSEPAGADVRPILREGAQVAAINLAEVIDNAMRLRRMPRDAIDRSIDRLVRHGMLTVVGLDDPTARRAGELRARFYDSKRSSVSLADCVAAATAETARDSLATPDRPLAKLARELGVEVIALPDSSGKRP